MSLDDEAERNFLLEYPFTSLLYFFFAGLHVFLNFASSVEFALLTYAGMPRRQLVVEYVRTDTWKYFSHVVTKHVVATYYMAMCCTVPLTPCVGCHFNPGATPRIFSRVSDFRDE